MNIGFGENIESVTLGTNSAASSTDQAFSAATGLLHPCVPKQHGCPSKQSKPYVLARTLHVVAGMHSI